MLCGGRTFAGCVHRAMWRPDIRSVQLCHLDISYIALIFYQMVQMVTTHQRAREEGETRLSRWKVGQL